MRELLNFVRHELGERLRDGVFRAGLLHTPVLHPVLELARQKHPHVFENLNSWTRRPAYRA